MTLNTVFVHSLETMYFLLVFFALFQVRKRFILFSDSNQKSKIRIRQKQRQVRKQKRKTSQPVPASTLDSYTGIPVQEPKAASCYFNQIPELEVSISSDPNMEIIYEKLPVQDRDSVITVEEENTQEFDVDITLNELLTPVASIPPSLIDAAKSESEFDFTLDELLAPEADLAIIVEESTELKLDQCFTVAFEEKKKYQPSNAPDNRSILDSYIDNFFSVPSAEEANVAIKETTAPIRNNRVIHRSDTPANDESITLFALDS